MKPRIFKRDGNWWMRFWYKAKPRTFWSDQRLHNCVQESRAESWRDALDCLRELYKRREVVR